MKQRTITAIIALAIFIPIVWYGSFLLVITSMILSMVGIHEFYQMKYRGQNRILEEGLAILASWVLIVPHQLIPANKLLTYYVLAMVLMVLTVFNQDEYSIDTIGFPIFTSLYLGFGFSNLVAARNAGFVLLLFALCVVWATDIGAYLIGRAIGRHKLAPSVSPNKTIEGSIGGIGCALLVLLVFMMNFKSAFPYHFSVMIVLTIFFSLAGQFGDLVESAYKRHYGVKDSGNILPGHGGILDRFDNLLFVFPIMALCGLF